jgi:hypothetical protein
VVCATALPVMRLLLLRWVTEMGVPLGGVDAVPSHRLVDAPGQSPPRYVLRGGVWETVGAAGSHSHVRQVVGSSGPARPVVPPVAMSAEVSAGRAIDPEPAVEPIEVMADADVVKPVEAEPAAEPAAEPIEVEPMAEPVAEADAMPEVVPAVVAEPAAKPAKTKKK